MSTVPGAWGGDTATIWLPIWETIFGLATVPKVTVLTLPKPLPWMVTLSPPQPDPVFGVTDVMLGAPDARTGVAGAVAIAPRMRPGSTGMKRQARRKSGLC